MFAEFCQFVRVSRALPTLDFLGTKREEVYTNATETLFGGNKGTVVSSRIVAERSEQREETRSDRSVAVVRTFGGARDYRPFACRFLVSLSCLGGESLDSYLD